MTKNSHKTKKNLDKFYPDNRFLDLKILNYINKS